MKIEVHLLTDEQTPGDGAYHVNQIIVNGIVMAEWDKEALKIDLSLMANYIGRQIKIYEDGIFKESARVTGVTCNPIKGASFTFADVEEYPVKVQSVLTLVDELGVPVLPA